MDGLPIGINSELVDNCRVVHDRHEILRRLPKGGVFAEVGTMFGDFIVEVVDIVQPVEVHVFDFGMNNIRAANQERLGRHSNVTYHVGDSSENMSKLPDNYFDVIYVDADHTFDGVWKDLMQAHRALKPTGYIICNDYTNFDILTLGPCGVYSAVNKFCNEFSYKFEYLALAPFGFHDVAVRRWR